MAAVEEHQFWHQLHLADLNGRKKDAIVEYHATTLLAAQCSRRLVLTMTRKVDDSVGLCIEPSEDFKRRKLLIDESHFELAAKHVCDCLRFRARTWKLLKWRTHSGIADDVSALCRACPDLRAIPNCLKLAHESLGHAEWLCSDTHELLWVRCRLGIDDEYDVVELRNAVLQVSGNHQLEEYACFLLLP